MLCLAVPHIMLQNLSLRAILHGAVLHLWNKFDWLIDWLIDILVFVSLYLSTAWWIKLIIVAASRTAYFVMVWVSLSQALLSLCYCILLYWCIALFVCYFVICCSHWFLPFCWIKDVHIESVIYPDPPGGGGYNPPSFHATPPTIWSSRGVIRGGFMWSWWKG